MSDVDVVTETVIDRPRADVAAYVSDADRDAERLAEVAGEDPE